MKFMTAFRSFVTGWRDTPAEANSVLGNRYIVKKVIGEGSYGITYQCFDRTNGCLVAVKQARPSKGSLARLLLEREAAVLQSLHHPQIPAYHGLFIERRNVYLSMSYVTGDTLEQLIFEQAKPFGEKACIRMTLQLLEIILYVHEKGFVHLDLRIPNVIFQDEQCYVIDFGLARRIGEPPVLSKRHAWRMGKSINSSSARPLAKADIQADLQDIGHWMLFILYSAYTFEGGGEAAEERSWQEELAISAELKMMIERLLSISEPYSDSGEFMHALQALAAETSASI